MSKKEVNRQKRERTIDLKKVVVTPMTRNNSTVGLRGLHRPRA